MLVPMDPPEAPPPEIPEPWDTGPTLAGLAVSLGLLAFYAALSGAGVANEWTRRGGANARALLDGDWGRAVTALTLHADVPHVVANAVLGAVVLTGLCRAFGVGLGLLMVVVTGAAGNVLNAAFQGPPHTAIGASTGVFAALGLLAGLQLIRRPWRQGWGALAAGLALLALLGTAAGTDILAHLFGFGAGLGGGVVVALVLNRPPGRPAQWGLSVAATTLVVGAWIVVWR